MKSSSPLRYVDAGQLDTTAGRLNDVVLLSPTDARLGKLDGVVIDPTARRVCFYVVKTRSRLTTHRYLLPVTTACLGAERRTLHVDVEPDDLHRLPQADSQNFQRFSDFDAADAMFAPRPHA
jgi:hypothetical protein